MDYEYINKKMKNNFEAPSPNSISKSSPLAKPIATKIESQYLAQHEKWFQLRHKIKSMQLNKICVTTYLKNGKKDNSNRQKLIAQSEHKLQVDSLVEQRYDNPTNHPTQFVSSHNLNDVCQRIFSSQNKSRQKVKKTRMTPYLSSAYKMDCSRVKSSKKAVFKDKQVSSQIHNPQQNQSIAIDNKDLKQYNKSQYILPPQLQLKMKKRERNLQKTKTNGNSSSGQYVNNIAKNTNRLQVFPLNGPKHKLQSNRNSNDLMHFCKISPQDVTKRVIVRRKSNIQGDYIQAIQSSIVKRKIILFTADITSGDGNIFEDINLKSPTNVFEIRSINFIVPRQESKIITHRPTRTTQLKLYLGPNQVMEYAQLFNFSTHPLQIQQSTSKLAAILVDFLSITTNGIKIQKNQIISQYRQNQDEQNRKRLQQRYRQIQGSQLTHWKNQNRKHISKSAHKKFINTQYNIIYNNLNKDSQLSNQEHRKIQYYKAYGHPHPVINGNQYQKIITYENNHQTVENQLKSVQNPSPVKKQKSQPNHQIEQNLQKNESIPSEVPRTITAIQEQSKIISQKSKQISQIKQNISKIDQAQAQNKKFNKVQVQKKTLSVKQQIVQNQSKIKLKGQTQQIKVNNNL